MANKSLSLFQKPSKQDFVGFDINDDYLKIVHVKNTKLRREVLHLISREARGMTDDEISLFVRQTMEGLKLTDPRVFINAPLHTVITRSIEIPSVDPEEIREIVNLQASRHTPYARSEIIVDTLNLGLVRENYTKVLLVIVPRDIVIRQAKILEKAGLKPEKVVFAPEAIGHACSKILNIESSDSTTAIVHMDTMFTSFIVVQRNNLLFIRGIPVGANHLLEEKEIYTDRFVDELQKSLESYTLDEAGPQPSLLLLTGVVAEINDLDELFKDALHMPIKKQTYFNHFSISNEARVVASSAKLVSYFNVIAPLLLYDRNKIDLVSEEQKLRRQLEQRGEQMIRTGILTLIILMLSFISIGTKVYFKNQYLNRLTARYQPVREDARHLEEIFAKTQLVKGYLAGRGRSIESLSALYDALPSDVRLSDIKFDQTEKFSVKGTSRTMASAFAFVSNLERSEQFSNVKTKYVTTRNEEGADVADFEIVARIGDASNAEAKV